jgi:hypothetical protein
MRIFRQIAAHGVCKRGIGSLHRYSYLLSFQQQSPRYRPGNCGSRDSAPARFCCLHSLYSFFQDIFQWISNRFVDLIEISHKGTEFLFGDLANQSAAGDNVFAIQVLPTIVFFAALSSLLYYLGLLQVIVLGFAWVMSKTMKQISVQRVFRMQRTFSLGKRRRR